MAIEKKESPTCVHCEQFHAMHKAPEGALCNNCILISPERRQLDKKNLARVAKMKAEAITNAKRLYDEELKKINRETVAEVLKGDE